MYIYTNTYIQTDIFTDTFTNTSRTTLRRLYEHLAGRVPPSACNGEAHCKRATIRISNVFAQISVKVFVNI